MDLDRAIEILEEFISELKPETYGAAIGTRLNRANADVNKEREAQEEFDKDKTNTEKANTLDDIVSHNKYDYDSNTQKAARAIARVKTFMKNRNWSEEQKNAFKEAAKKAQTVEAKGGPYSVEVSYNPKFTSEVRRKGWKSTMPRFKNYEFDKNEAFALVEEIIAEANSIFEADPQASEGVEGVPPSTNQIKQTKKDKETGKKTEVVSVADELFPYEGNAKQQLNQKILAKINDMIQGTATLEDLMQLVRKNTKKPVTVKESWDKAEAVLEEVIKAVNSLIG